MSCPVNGLVAALPAIASVDQATGAAPASADTAGHNAILNLVVSTGYASEAVRPACVLEV